MSIKVKILGLKKTQQNLIKYNLAKRGQVIQLIQATALDIETNAKKNTPVDTGRLRSSIKILYKSLSGLGVEVGSNVLYAMFVEYGAGGRNPKPFLNPALETAKPKYLKELKKILSSTK